MSIYEENGYEDRKAYLRDLAEQYDVEVSYVFSLANLLGPEEDFDGLVSAVQDVGGRVA